MASRKPPPHRCHRSRLATVFLSFKRSGVLFSTTRAQRRTPSPKPRATTPPLPRRQTQAATVHPRWLLLHPAKQLCFSPSKSRPDSCVVLTLPASFPAGGDGNWLNPSSGLRHPFPIPPGHPSCCSRTTCWFPLPASPLGARGIQGCRPRPFLKRHLFYLLRSFGRPIEGRKRFRAESERSEQRYIFSLGSSNKPRRPVCTLSAFASP